MSQKVIGLVASAVGGLDALHDGLVAPLVARGCRVAVTLTPTAGAWLEDIGDTARIAATTGLPVRTSPRLPREQSPHPPIDLYIGAPLSANSTAKLALGIADNQALTVLCENIATTPMIIFPRVNAAHARQPAWDEHLRRLYRSPIHLIWGEDVWPLAEPRTAGPNRVLPWSSIIDTAARILAI
ncbi:flavoprotein [Microlunatus parietis]|uniref:Flavoprotein domain-containing protein n=1 Tax=Microlunatus parietis TaxID=682979 RepID=A0A7Y9IF71_9ACTN|nr:flavoprotein [Microlunatus parietis]NYE75607.1 hypothetical protein [Microlunatus parietis]